MPKFSAYMKGGDGSVGPPGASIIDGVLANEGMLPVPNQGKYAFLVGTSDPKHLWVWNDQKEGENKWEDQGAIASEIGRVTASVSTIPWNAIPSISTQFSTSNQIDYFNFDFNIPMGRPAGFGDITATISSTNWDAAPAISTSTSGEDWGKNIHYDFTLPVGRPAGFGDINVTTELLPSGTPPWVSISTNEESPDYAKDFNFKFAIPEGVAAGFSTTQHVTVSTLDTGENAIVEITTVTTSPETAKEFNFHFGLPRGDALAIYEGIPFTTEDGFDYHWDTTNTTTLIFNRGTVEKLPIYIYNSDNESIAATFKLSASTIEYEADEKFNGTMYLAMPTTLQNVEIGNVSSTTYGYEPIVSKSTGSTSTNLILDFVIPEGYPGHTIIDSMTTDIQTLFTEVNNISANTNSISTNLNSVSTRVNSLSTEKLNITGGTLTGGLTCLDNNIILKNSIMDRSATSISTDATSAFMVYDKGSSRVITAFGATQYQNGPVMATINARKVINNTSYVNFLYLRVNNDGSYQVQVASPEAWRAGIKAAPKALHISMPSTSSLGTLSNDNITTSMRVVNIVWGTPSNVISNVSWNTDTAGKLVLSGTLSGATTAEIDLVDFG